LKDKNSDTSVWHALNDTDVFAALDSSISGLSNEESIKRLKEFGANQLPDAKKISLGKIILSQLLNPLIFILIAAAVASIIIGEAKDAVFIFLVIFINSFLGTYQEYHAEKSASSLQKLMRIKARVRRENKERMVPAEELVVGDIVLLESGAKVPADMRLIEIQSLEVDESFLTGESLAAKKKLNLLESNTVVADRKNIAFAGSTVLKGRALGVVIATGLHTEVGKISKKVTRSESAKPPLVQRMELFIKQISVFIIVLSVLLAVALSYQGLDASSIFFFIVALAVSAIPEGLPVSLTVALSIATRRMAKRNVIVRKLTAVESLGSCTVIASDKTGTLTVNEQTAQKIVLADGTVYKISGVGYTGDGVIADASGKEIQIENKETLSIVMEISALANEGVLKKKGERWKHLGDSMDVALLGMVFKSGSDPKMLRESFEILSEIPYESENKFSATAYKDSSGAYVATKGAVETILDFCDAAVGAQGELVLDKKGIAAEADALAKQGFRVLALARGKYPENKLSDELTLEAIPPSVFYGLVGFIDPLREEAIASVQHCHSAGIRVLMITGDHPETAGTIARELGIADDNTKVVTGSMLGASGNPEDSSYRELVKSTTVFARVSPVQKLEIVDTLIKLGEFVAVTGDGVNDAPALKRANIGVAMGSGTDVAKEVGAMIVVDDNFASLVAGVEEGRFAYSNVRKVIYLLVSTGAAEIVLFLGAIFFGLPMPLLAVQLLWLNLVTNGIQDKALAFEVGEADTMKHPPRSTSEKIFNPLMIKQLVVSALTMGGIVFGLWYYLLEFTETSETHARDLILLLMVFMQNFHVFNARSERVSAFKIPLSRNYFLIVAVLAAQGIHILSMHIPFMQDLLRIQPITFREWLLVLILAIPIFLVMELFKVALRKFWPNA